MKPTAGLVLAGLLLFGASFNDSFHFDDTLILNDANVTNPAQWAHFLNPLHLRQITFFSFYLNYLAGGADPAGYHVVNVALHIANAVLFFFLLRRFVEERVAIAAAAIFLVHPIQTESVLYVYQRSVLLACLFSLLALSVERRWLAAVLFICAFESKESAVAVPLALAILTPKEWKETSRGQAASAAQPPVKGTAPFLAPRSGCEEVPDNSTRGGARRWLAHPWLGSVHAFGVLAVVLGPTALALLAYWGERTVGIYAMSPLKYFLAQTRVIFTYLRLLVFPYPQSLEYEWPSGSALIFFIALLGVVWLLPRIPKLCVLAFLILLAPTSSFIPSADAAFEHRLYLPMLAFSVLAAHLLYKRRTVLITVLCVLGVLTIRRGMVWSSDIALWEDTVKHAPGKARVWFNLGGAYLSSDPEKARAALVRALEIEPDFPEAYYDLGVIEQEKRNWNVALAYYERALSQNPDYWPAANNMGNTLFAMGQRDRALEYFDNTLRLNPGYWPAQYNSAIVHFQSGRYEKAVSKLRTVLDWRPDFREARYLLALSLTQAGDRGAADAEWKKLGGFTAAESRITPTMILAPNRP